jgi:hypothetical protein
LQAVSPSEFLRKYKLPRYVRVSDRYGWRFYCKKEDVNRPKNWFASVTNILDLPVSDRTKRYYMSMTKEKWQRAVMAGNAGTICHHIVSEDLMGGEIRPPAGFGPFYDSWSRLRSRYKIEGYVTELPVFNEEYGYAGTLDILGELMSKPIVADLKSGRYDIKTGWQVAAYKYALMDMMCDTEFGWNDWQAKDCGIVGLNVTRDGRFAKAFIYRQVPFCFTAFLSAFNLWKAMYVHRLERIGWKYCSLHEVPEVPWAAKNV